jgi:hypothetical protein
MKLRIKGVKREHSTIKGIVPLLEKITAREEVSAIIPGRIKPIVGNYPKPVIEFKMETPSGIKCSAKSERSVQELFIVTKDYKKTLEFISTL